MTTNNCDWHAGCLIAGKHQCPACGEWFCSGHLDESGCCLQCAVDQEWQEAEEYGARLLSDDDDLDPYKRSAGGLVD
ncbi:hypothetical protein LCGC14_1485960 [marine sediment metagenome]|uniref:Uncharacterized protein n=1 Tax=marine sediment metagenome TaxID=412755 RepID=A0A0F9J834_9ZZZZ